MEGRDVPHVRQLLGLHAAGDMLPEPVRLGPLPARATPAMRSIAAEIELRLGLLLADGVTRALQYARSEAVNAGYVGTLRGASYVLHRLEAEGVIVCVGEMPKLGKGNGTRLFVPPGWHPAEPLAVAIERAGQQGLADLVWVPDEPRDPAGAGAVRPDIEVADQLLVGGSQLGGHGGDGRPGRGVWRWSS